MGEGVLTVMFAKLSAAILVLGLSVWYAIWYITRRFVGRFFSRLGGNILWCRSLFKLAGWLSPNDFVVRPFWSGTTSI